MKHNLRRLFLGVLSLAIMAGWLLVTAVPAAAIVGWGITNPPAGTRLTSADPVTIVAFVDAQPTDSIDAVDVRFSQGGNAVGSVQRLAFRNTEQLSAGVQRSYWTASLDPLAAHWFGGTAVPNGYYQLQARVQYRVQDIPQDPTPWSEGHALVLDVPPPRTAATAALAERNSRRVEVTWQPVGGRVPDFTRYVVERAPRGGSFRPVYETSAPSEDRYIDTVPPGGDYRYRVGVHRSSADGGERTTVSSETDPVTAQETEAPSEETDDESEGDSEPGEPGEATDDDGTGDAGAPAPSPRPPVVRRGTARPPSVGVQPPSLRSTGEAPAVADNTFRETLDYGDVPEYWEEEVASREPIEPESQARGLLEVIGTPGLQTEQVLVPLTGGFLFILAAAHVARFLRQP